MPEITKELMVVNQLGIHARPAAALVQRVLQFESEVYLSCNGNRANAKSIMGLLSLAATRGTRVTVTCNGEDAEAAMETVQQLFMAGFEEK